MTGEQQGRFFQNLSGDDLRVERKLAHLYAREVGAAMEPPVNRQRIHQFEGLARVTPEQARRFSDAVAKAAVARRAKLMDQERQHQASIRESVEHDTTLTAAQVAGLKSYLELAKRSDANGGERAVMG